MFFLQCFFAAGLPVYRGVEPVADHEGVFRVAVEADVLQPASCGGDVREVQAPPLRLSAGHGFDAFQPGNDFVLLYEELVVDFPSVQQAVHFLVVFLGVGGVAVCHGEVACVAVDAGD